MDIRENIQEEMKKALKAKDTFRLECLRMAKGALILKDKESSAALTDEASIVALRAEIRKRQQSIEIFRQHGRETEAASTEREIAIFEEFLPKQLGAEELEARVRSLSGGTSGVESSRKVNWCNEKRSGRSGRW